MSLPSIPAIAKEWGLNLADLAPYQRTDLLVEAMRRDLPLAVELLSRKAEAENGDWLEDPNSPIGKQLIRLHASDALRPLASRHFCGDKPLTFVNCCGGIVGGKKKTPDEIALLQIESQAGPVAYADC